MKIFIGSSKEVTEGGQNSLLQQIAVIVSQAGFTPVKWNKTPTIFQTGRTTIENLENLITKENIDASIFIFSEKDKSWERENDVKVPRSNVLFELGLFTAKLGRTKSIIIKSGNVEIPSDLLGVTYIDFNDATAAESNIQQWLEELKNENSTITAPIKSKSCVYPEELNCARAKIEQELKNITASGIIKVFDNQHYAIKDYGKKTPQNVRILCIRGGSFLSDDLWDFSEDDINEAILGDSANDTMIMGRYEAQKKKKDSPESFKERYKKGMIESQGKYPDNVLYIHNETNLPFRMLFVDDYLYLSVFQKNIKASELSVMKIQKDSALYSGCEEYYNKILNNATPSKR